MKRHIFVSSVALLTALIWSSWNSMTQAQGYRPSRRAEWQQRVLQDANPGSMTPAAAFGDEPLMVQREYKLDMVSEGTVQNPSILPQVADPNTVGPVGPVAPGEMVDDCGCGGTPCDDCGCDDCQCGDLCCGTRFCSGLLYPQALNPVLRRTEFFAGVHGFKGPIDQGTNGNFGFHGGFNFSGPIGGYYRNGYQLGLNIVGSDYSGSTIMGDDSGDRKQLFFTGGLFHRALNGGMQAGLVYDFLQDSFYFGRAHLGQVRAEVSWGRCGYQEVGFWGAFRTRSDQLTQTIGQTTYNWEVKPNNLYAFFYRRNFCEGGEGRIWGGFTGNSEAMFGADARVPLTRSFALETSFNYVIPKDNSGIHGATEESWGLLMNVVWYPGRSAKSVSCDPFRPLFGVGNNNTFMTTLLQ